MLVSHLEWAIGIDIGTVLICTVLLLRYGRLAHSHPLTIYLVFHLLVVTSRLWAIANGAPTLFADWGIGFEAVSERELVRAVLLFDIALLVATFAAIKASHDDGASRSSGSNTTGIPIQPKNIWRIVAFALPIGVVGLLFFAHLPGRSPTTDLGAWGRSTWLTMTVTWVGLSLLALIYLYGFRWYLTLPMIIYLSIMAYQGYHRFRVILPILLLTQIYLDRRELRWPRGWIAFVLGLTALLFFPLKRIGSALQDEVSIGELRRIIVDSMTQVANGRDGNQQFLDMFASALTLVDRNGQFFWGMPYAKLLILPIPRPLWPGKPSFADYMFAIETPWRPMGISGMIVTYLGEAYANFSYVGVILIPLLVMYFLSRFYFRAYRLPYYTVQRLAYLLLAANLILLFRDGLTAIVIFVFVSMLPLTMIVFLHLPIPGMKRRHRRRYIHVPKPHAVMEQRSNEAHNRRTSLSPNHITQVESG